MKPDHFKRVDQILQQALSQLPATRKSYLDQACAGDQDLRREVESLLGHERDAPDSIAWPPDELAARCFAGDQEELPQGKRIASYQIEALIGSGGMGRVYRARDERLGRHVALKVLPDLFANERERRARFEREARLLASLNHPNIAAIYALEEAGGSHFLVLELVEGETLSQRLSRGAPPLNETLNICLQVAEGLEAAHEKGIIHRDLKPANVMITTGNRVKILDFGLAKLKQTTTNNADDSVGRMDTSTEEGTIAGTPAYMSPEQAEGQPVDARSDIFTFGALLYEMVTGRRAFKGGSKMSTLAAVLHEQPEPVRRIAGGIPQELELIITRCLKKDPERRFQHIDDVKIALQEFREERDKRKWLKRRYLIWVSMALAVALAALAWVYWRSFLNKSSLPEMQTVGVTSFEGGEYCPSFSPDGNQIAFVWDGQNHDNFDIYVMQVGGATPFRLTTGPELDVFPAWSPDGREIAFIRYRPNKLQAILAISPLGGPERKLAEGIIGGGTIGRRMGWSPDGKHLAFQYKDSQLEPWSIYSLSLGTLEKKRLTYPQSGTEGDFCPAFSPDGRQLGFVRAQAGAVMDIYTMPSSGGESRRLTTDGREVIGICWSMDSSEIIFSSQRTGFRTLWRIPASGGSPLPVQGAGEDANEPIISARGDRLAYMKASGHSEIYKIDLTSADEPAHSSKRLIFSTRSEMSPSISPDGSRIAFQSFRSGRGQIWMCDSDGNHSVQLTSLNADSVGSPSWSPDGQFIAFDSTLAGNSDIFVISPEVTQPRQVTTETSQEIVPSWSRDGRWIYFGSNRSGSWQIWKVQADGGKAVQVTKKGGSPPCEESADGKFVYFVKEFEQTGIWRIPVEGGPETLVLDRVPSLWEFGTSTERGIYFWKEDTRPSIEFLEFATQRVTRIAPVKEGLAPVGGRMLSVSPDGKWLAYGAASSWSRDIMMIDHFR